MKGAAATVQSNESEEDPTCDVDGFLGSTGNTAVSTLHCRELHQSLPLEGHHHDITGGREDKQHVHHQSHLVAEDDWILAAVTSALSDLTALGRTRWILD